MMEELVPIKSHIGSGDESSRLRELEKEIALKIRDAAREWQALISQKRGHYPRYWEEAIPSEIATICEHFGFVACERTTKKKEALDFNGR